MRKIFAFFLAFLFFIPSFSVGIGIGKSATVWYPHASDYSENLSHEYMNRLNFFESQMPSSYGQTYQQKLQKKSSRFSSDFPSIHHSNQNYSYRGVRLGPPRWPYRSWYTTLVGPYYGSPAVSEGSLYWPYQPWHLSLF